MKTWQRSSISTGGGLEHAWSKMKTYMGNTYASKSHTHTASQITDFTSQVDNRINSKMGSYASIKYGSQSKTSSTSFSRGTQSLSFTVTLDAMSVNQLAYIKFTAVLNMTGPNDMITNKQAPYTVNVNLPSGGTYWYNGTFYSGGSKLVSKTGTVDLTWIPGMSSTISKTESWNLNIVRVA